MAANSHREPLKPLARSATLFHLTQESIKNYILENGLRPGDPLPPETQLARQLGISRNSVREAVKALESLGILETRPGSGLFVCDFSFEPLLDNLAYGMMSDLQELADLLEVRRVLETGMIVSAMEGLADGRIDALVRLTGEMRLLAEQGAISPAADRKFHNTLFAHMGNKALLKVLDVFWLAFRKASDHADLKDPDPMSTYLDHVAIVDAVTARDVKKTRVALDRHYAGIEGRLAREQQERRT